jgi:hypothetical protein
MEGPSIGSSISAALEHTQRLLFQPFRFKFWLKLGVIIFFIGGSFSSGGGGSNFNPSGSGSGSGGMPDLGPLKGVWEVMENFWMQNQMLAILLIIIGGALLIGISLLAAYLASVARFMFVETILKEDIHLKESFLEHKIPGFKFWLWTMLLSFLSLFVIGIPIGGIIVSALMIKAFKVAGIVLTILFSLLTIAVIIGVIIFFLYNSRFIPAVMYLENRTFWEAWGILYEYIKTYLGKFILFVLMWVVLGTVVGIIGLLILLISIIPAFPILLLFYVIGAAIWETAKNVASVSILIIGGVLILFGMKYVWSVLWAPLEVFTQSYALAFLDGCNEAWNIDLIPRPSQYAEPQTENEDVSSWESQSFEEDFEHFDEESDEGGDDTDNV